jgi:hypothetical protein
MYVASLTIALAYCCGQCVLRIGVWFSARASVQRYIDFIGRDTLASELLGSPSPWLIEGWWTALFEWGRNAFLCADFDEASRVLLAAWSFVQDQAHPSDANDGKVAAPPAATAAVVSSSSSPSSLSSPLSCQHCALVAGAGAGAGADQFADRGSDIGDASGSANPAANNVKEHSCWLCGYLRNLCTQAHLAKEDEEGQFVLEGFQQPSIE